MDYLLHCSIISVASRAAPQNMHCGHIWFLLRPQGIQCPRTVRKSEDTDSILCNLGSVTSSLWVCLALLGDKKRNKYQLQGICNLKNHIAYEKNVWNLVWHIHNHDLFLLTIKVNIIVYGSLDSWIGRHILWLLSHNNL